jgi:rRNA maturation RNase YbeY
MHTIQIFVESRYKVDRKKIKKAITETLSENGIQSPTEISVAVVGDRKMTYLNQHYRQKQGTTNVLSFVAAEGEKLPETELDASRNRLGDIILSYPQVIRDAARDDMLVDDKVDELIRHSMLHLLGVHHE